MTDIQQLYQDVILDHYRNPRNRGPLVGCTHTASGKNPMCGDRVDIHLDLDPERVRAVCFEGEGCAISQASASMLSEAVSGATVTEARRLAAVFQSMLDGSDPSDDALLLRQLAVFVGVRGFPSRVGCARLAWTTLLDALASAEPVVRDGESLTAGR